MMNKKSSFKIVLDNGLENFSIWPIIPYCSASLQSVAPENVPELLKMIADITLFIKNSNAWDASYRPGPNVIEISRRALEATWCASYAYTSLYMAVQEGSFSNGVAVDLKDMPQLKRATELFHWAIEDVALEKESTPPMLPVVIPQKAKDLSNEELATELTIAAVGFMMHHELAHARLGHQSIQLRNAWGDIFPEQAARSIDQEKAADEAAARWMLEKKQGGDLKFHKTLMGILISLNLLLTLSLRRRQNANKPFDIRDQSHPFGYTRIDAAINRFPHDQNGLAWAFEACTLKLHLDGMGLVDRGPYATWKIAADDYLDILADFLAKQA